MQPSYEEEVRQRSTTQWLTFVGMTPHPKGNGCVAVAHGTGGDGPDATRLRLIAFPNLNDFKFFERASEATRHNGPGSIHKGCVGTLDADRKGGTIEINWIQGSYIQSPKYAPSLGLPRTMATKYGGYRELCLNELLGRHAEGVSRVALNKIMASDTTQKKFIETAKNHGFTQIRRGIFFITAKKPAQWRPRPIARLARFLKRKTPQ